MPKRRGWGGDDYYDYYPSSTPRRVAGGLKTKNERGAIGETWWSKRWVKVLESFGMGSRLTRGRSYARQGQVISIDLEVGEVKAKVQGSSPRPYKVEIRLKPLSEAQWDKVTEVMANQAIFAAKLLAGEMPQNIEEAFAAAKVSLMPTSLEELETDCTCPDWSNPCKHIAAVYYLLAERFDEDPFLIFKLRGRTKEQLIQILREKRAETETTSPEESLTLTPTQAEIAPNVVKIEVEKARPLEESLATFWQTGEELASFEIRPALPEVENALLKRLGEPPFRLGNQELSSLLAKAYLVASQLALQKASEAPSNSHIE